MHIESNSGLMLNKSTFFGYYTQNPKLFEISLGERIQLKEVAIFAKQKFETDGPSYFCDKKNLKLISFSNTIDCGDFGLLFTNKGSVVNKTKEIDKNKLKSTLHANLIDILKSSNIDQACLAQLTEEMVGISSTNDIVRGSIQCVLCDTNEIRNKKTEFIVNAKLDGDNVYWIFSNYIRHLKSQHGIITKQNPSRGKKQKTNVQVPDKQRRSVSIDSDANKNKDKRESPGKLDQCSPIEDIASDRTDENESDQTDQMKTGEIEISDQFFVDCDTKMESIRDVMCRSISTQCLDMLENSETHGESNYPMQYICCKHRRSLKIVKIKKDGNCLFGAIVHQLHKIDVARMNTCS